MRIFLAAIITLTAALAANAQTAEGGAKARNGAKFGAWTLRCVAEGVGETKCGLVQRLAQAETNAFVAEIALNRAETAEGPRTLMVLLTPDAMALNLLPAYVVDEAEAQVTLNWRTCAQRLCRAAALLTPEDEAALKAGDKMTLAYQRFGAAEPVRLGVSLQGVTAGLAALAGQ